MHLDEEDVAKYVVLFGILVAAIGWPFGIYYFGAEVYASSWNIGPVFILCFWILLGLPILFVGGAVIAFLNFLILHLILEVVRKD